MRVSPKEKKNLLIKNARNGKGIFVQKDFLAEEIIFEVRGVLIACDEDENIDEETRANTYRYDEDLYISPKGTIGDFLNHSCTPNAKVCKKGKRLYIQAIKSIPNNKEVVIDYATITASDDSWKMKCNCGSKKCRLIIGTFKSLPKEVKQKYIDLAIVPSYILELCL